MADAAPAPAPTLRDYEDIQFAGKAEQMKAVSELIRSKHMIPDNLVEQEVAWFYNNLGIDELYFRLEETDVISKHILALYGAKVMAASRENGSLDIELEQETKNGAVYIHNSRPGMFRTSGKEFEKIIDDRYLDITGKDAYRLETYRSRGTVASGSNVQLRCYFLNRCDFVNPEPSAGETDVRVVADKIFLERATEGTLEVYQRVMTNVINRTGAVIEQIDAPEDEKRLIIGFRRGTTQRYFSALSDLYHYYDLYSTRKYVETFSNGVVIFSIYLKQARNEPSAPSLESSIIQITKEASLLYCLPNTPFHPLFQKSKLSVQETTYAYVTYIFCQHFLNRLGSEYITLQALLNQKEHEAVLTQIKKRLREDTFTRENILAILSQRPELIQICYKNFALAHHITVAPKTSVRMLKPTLSVQRLKTEDVLSDEDILKKIRSTVDNDQQYEVFRCLLMFNQHVLKTNFYQPTKVALSFRMNPLFLPVAEYPNKLFGMFFVIGSEFRGFHLRFADIARGGIRIVRSVNKEVFSANCRNLFDENYNLASTQDRKNKDIPESGAKGTILLDENGQSRATFAFEKYIDSILDLLLIGQSPGIKDRIVDLYGKQEILFFGPDEGTADLMNWASAHAKRRGVPTWKAFTTGKSPKFGGIPHDKFGMTTRSVHQYVLGIIRKLGIREEDLDKLQTGGPDGDLGSNEIKISKDRTIAIVDGSGVIYDPVGLDRAELLRLAEARLMISQFDVAKLSPAGFRVLVDQASATLPDGTVVERCLEFRNRFHLLPYSTATLFVPCGGRPEAVNITNVPALFHADGKPRFSYIVEGANLFFTQQARLYLESRGVIVFKDASANKGGVTSSSLEVLAALAFTDEEFHEHMQVHDEANPPPFYQEYVKDVQATIEENAQLEFECLWMEHHKQKKPLSILSDELSLSILRMVEELEKSNFWDNANLRYVVLSEAFPQTLLKKLGFDTLLRRVPLPYLQAIFYSRLASRFVYQYGVSPSQFAFFSFMTEKWSQNPANALPAPAAAAAAPAEQ